MNFESLIKVIEDEVNMNDYNSDIILTNTNTGKKLIIPKTTVNPEVVKPINFFDIPLDIRTMIYDRVRNLKKYDNYISYDKFLKLAQVSIEFHLRKKPMENVNFIDSDDEETEVITTEDTREKANENLIYLTQKIIKDREEIKEKITERIITTRYPNTRNKNEITKIITFNFCLDIRNRKIDHIITNDILRNEYNLLKFDYDNYEIIEDNRFAINSNYRIINYNLDIDYLQLYKKEFGEDEKLKKIMNDYKIEFDEYSRIHTMYMGERTERHLQHERKIFYNLEYKKMFFDKIYLIYLRN